jgi:phosphoribosylglycinamide formyltransferase-1
MKPPLRLGVLGSGRGSNFLAIADAIEKKTLEAEIVLVASDLGGAPILESARQRGLATYSCPKSRFKTKLEPEIEACLAHCLKVHEVDYVVLAGFMRVVKSPLLEAFPRQILNIHPSLLPAFKGLGSLEAGAGGGGFRDRLHGSLGRRQPGWGSDH